MTLKIYILILFYYTKYCFFQPKVVKNTDEKLHSHKKRENYIYYINSFTYYFKTEHNLCDITKPIYLSEKDEFTIVIAKNVTNHETFSFNEYSTIFLQKWKFLENALINYWWKYADLIEFLQNPNKDLWKLEYVHNKKYHAHSFLSYYDKRLVNHHFKSFEIYQNNQTKNIIAVHKKAHIMSNIFYGNRCIILKYCKIFEYTKIGNDVLIGEACTISSFTKIKNKNIFLRNVSIANYVYIGSYNIFMAYVRIGLLYEEIEFKHNNYFNIVNVKPEEKHLHSTYIILFEILNNFSTNIFIGKGNVFNFFTSVKNHCFFSNTNFLGKLCIVYEMSFFLSKNIFLFENYIMGRVVVFNNFIFSHQQKINRLSKFFFDKKIFNIIKRDNGDKEVSLYIPTEEGLIDIGLLQKGSLYLYNWYIEQIFFNIINEN